MPRYEVVIHLNNLEYIIEADSKDEALNDAYSMSLDYSVKDILEGAVDDIWEVE